jgi:hypothetical protein
MKWKKKKEKYKNKKWQACELKLSFSLGGLSVSACSKFLQGSAICSFPQCC